MKWYEVVRQSLRFPKLKGRKFSIQGDLIPSKDVALLDLASGEVHYIPHTLFASNFTSMSSQQVEPLPTVHEFVAPPELDSAGNVVPEVVPELKFKPRTKVKKDADIRV